MHAVSLDEKEFGKTGKNLQNALDDIENEMSSMTVEQRFDSLCQQMIAFAFYIIDRHRRLGEPIHEHEQQWQKAAMEELKMIERVFAMAKKNNRIYPKPNEQFDEQLIAKIKEMKSTVGDIVRKLPEKSEDDKKGDDESL